jgi:site-specific DNA-methyltransferase (adenine-specific)/modification methylase
MRERITDRIEIVNADCYTLLNDWPSDAALVTDPPYGIGYVLAGDLARAAWPSTHVGRTIHGDGQEFDPTPFLRFDSVLLWGADHFRRRLPNGGTMLAWDKTDGRDNTCPLFVACEFAWCNRAVKQNIVRHLWSGFFKTRTGEDDYGNHDGKNVPRLHPAQKPVNVCAWCLRALGLPANALVIDPFMGSGSLGVACHRAGLRYLGVEIDAEHYATARERLRRETAQGLLMPTGFCAV